MRVLTAAVVATLLAALMYVASFSWWMEREILDQSSFVDSTIDALALESSRDAMGQLITDRLIDEFSLLIVLESNLVDLFSELLGTPELEEVLALVAAEAHDRMISGDQDAVVVDLADYRELIVAPVEAVSPQLAELIPERWFTSVVVLEAELLPDLSLYDRWMGAVKIIAMAGSIALLIFVWGWARPRGLALVVLGAASVLTGLATAVLVPGGLVLALGQVQDVALETLVTNTYVQFMSYLKLSALVFTLVGVVLVAIGVAVWTNAPEDASGRATS